MVHSHPVLALFNSDTLHCFVSDSFTTWHSTENRTKLLFTSIFCLELTISLTNFMKFGYFLNLIYNRVIIQKIVFETRYSYSKFLVMPFRVINAQYSGHVIIIFSLFMIKFIRIFLVYDILIYSQSNSKHAKFLRFLLQTLHSSSRTASYHAEKVWVS